MPTSCAVPFLSHVASYLTVLYHGDIGFLSRLAYRHFIRSGAERLVIPLADNPDRMLARRAIATGARRVVESLRHFVGERSGKPGRPADAE